MRRTLVFIALLAASALAGPGAALAGEQTLTFMTEAISVEGYGVVQKAVPAPSPSVDGYVVGMSAEVVDAAGTVLDRSTIMLHHVAFGKLGVPDSTCSGTAERFYAEGEERAVMSLPGGYGYPNRGSDRWYLLYMLMNHKPQTVTGYVRYHVRYVTGEQLVPVRPVWLDVRNCAGLDPVFDVPGTGPRFSTFTKTWDYTMPESGRFVAGLAHLHGGGVRLELRNATCGTVPFTSLPSWGAPVPKPILHEPGPAKMSQFRSTQGIPVSVGDRLRLAAVYDNDLPHTRAMGIMLLYFAPGPVSACEATPQLDVELGSPSAPPPFTFPLPRAPRGPVARNARSTWVSEYRFGIERIALPRGATFTWRFVGATHHDVTVVGGPVGFSSPWTLAGTFSHRFSQPGTYRLFCSLHPSRMVQVLSVR